jgi:peptidyl-prolyl cis-trans isomerase SurA
VRLTISALVACVTLLGTALTAADPAFAQAQSASRIAAVVNDDVISTQDLRERLRLALLFSGLPRDAETQQRIAPQVLRRVIDERLQLQEAARRGIVVQPQEIRGAVQNAAAANNMSAQQLMGYLAEQGVDPTALERQIEAELAWLQLVRRQFGDRLQVTDQQLELARAAAQQGGSTQVLLSEILLPIYDPAETQEVIAEAEDLRAAIREGADFSAIASQVSAAVSRGEGGDLGWVPLDGLQSSLRTVVAGLAPGQVSDPVATPSGVQLFYVRDRRIAGSDASPDIRQIAQLLFPVEPNASEAVLASVLAEAQSATVDVDNCDDVERIARQWSLPGSGDLGWMGPDDLPVDMVSVIERLPIDTLSQPIRSSSGLHYLMVCADGRSDADAAINAELRRGLEQEQLERLAGRYLRDLRKDAFIDVRIGG